MPTPSVQCPTHRRWWWTLAATFVAVVGGVAVAAAAVRAYLDEAAAEGHRLSVRRGEQEFEEQLAEVRAGRTAEMYLYDTAGTDALLARLAGEPEAERVEGLTLELTDATDAGLTAVAALPLLRRLVLYGGGGVTDVGLARLPGAASVEELELKNTRVTNDGLRRLADLPALRSLTVFCEPRLQTLDDGGLAALAGLTGLRRLHVSGGWASPAGVAELRRALPGCEVTVDR